MSAQISKYGVVFICIVSGLLCSNSLYAEEKSPPPPDPYADAQTLVEAFVVEVPTKALTEMGISPIGQEAEGLTVIKLAGCLMNESAKVISGVKVSVRQNEEGVSKESRTVYYKQINKNTAMVDKKPVTGIDVRYLDYAFKKQLSSHPIIRPDRSINVGYEYNESGVTPDFNHYDPNDNMPPSLYAYTWEGRLSLVSGQPVIAGAIQNQDHVIFLVLTATIQNLPEAKQEKSTLSAASQQNP